MIPEDTSALMLERGSPQPLGLSAGAMRVLVRPADGGRVAAFWREAAGRRAEVLMPMGDAGFDPLFWPKAGTYPLAPFSNRIRAGAFSFGEREVRLAAHPACEPHALHGFSQLRDWHVTQRSAAQIEMRYRHDPAQAPDTWPWSFEAIQKITLDPAGMTHEIGVESHADTDMPVGLGLHPYFAVARGDTIRFSAQAEWEQDEDGCATRLRRLEGSGCQQDRLHDGEPLTFYYAGWDGRAVITRQDGATITIEADQPFDHLVVHVPPGGAYLCIEPVSHVADAFNLASRGAAGTGMRVLAPGGAIWGRMRIGVT